MIADRDMINALDRCMQYQESFATKIDKANPNDHYQSLIIREDIEQLERIKTFLEQSMSDQASKVSR